MAAYVGPQWNGLVEMLRDHWRGKQINVAGIEWTTECDVPYILGQEQDRLLSDSHVGQWIGFASAYMRVFWRAYFNFLLVSFWRMSVL